MVVPRKFQQWQQGLAPVLARWGTYCASNQIQVLLIDCLVLSCLVCLVWPFDIVPELWPSQDASAGTSSVTLSQPLQQILRAHDIQASDNLMCRRAWPAERQIHLVQVALQSGDPQQLSEHGMLDRELLHRALGVQKTLSAQFVSQCIKDPKHPDACLILSPLTPWDGQEAQLLSNPDLRSTLAASSPQQLEGTLGHLRRAQDTAIPQSADEIIFTLFLQTPSGQSPAFNDAEIQVKLGAASRPYGTLVFSPASSVLASKTSKIVLKPIPDERAKEEIAEAQWTPLNDLTLWGYALVAVYVGYTMRRMDRVHSRAGLLFTALVTMGTSTLLSLSVCKILRFSVDGIPWKIIPLLITVLAVDNTFVLTHAVVSTPVEWPIPQRIGQGLAKVGPSIFLALVVEHILLFAAWAFIPIRSVREMVLLAAVALKADAAMQITLFLPVLSIDIQRLELSDLLRLGSPQPIKSDAQGSALTAGENSAKEQEAPSYKALMQGVWDGAKDRIARSITFVVVATVNFGMYATHGASYFLPPFCRDPRASAAAVTTVSSLWRNIASANSPVVHATMSQPAHLFLGASAHRPVSTLVVSTFMQTISFVLKIAIPAVSSTAGLYLLLQYLLKDKDLLEAEKAKAAEEHQLAVKAEAEARAPRAQGHMLDFRTPTDIELVASSATGDPVIVFWAVMQPHITVCRPTHHAPETEIVRLHLPQSTSALQHLAIDKEGRFSAAADRQGTVYIWDLGTGHLLHFTSAPGSSEDPPSVINLFSGQAQSHHAPPLPGQAQKVKERGVVFFAARIDGSMSYWDCLQSTSGQSIPPLTDQPKRVRFHFLAADDTPASSAMTVARSDAQGAMEIWTRISDGSWVQDGRLGTLLSDGGIASMVIFTLSSADEQHTLAVTGSTKGVVTVWEQVDSYWCSVTEFQAAPASLRQMRVLNGFSSPCPCAPELPAAGFALVYQAGGRLTFQRIFKAPDQTRCRCTLIQRPRHSESEANRWDSQSNRSSASPVPRPSRLPDLPKVTTGGIDQEAREQSEGSSTGKSATPSSTFSILPSSDSSSTEEVPSEATSNLLLRLGDSRVMEITTSDIWEQMGNTSVICGVQRATEIADLGRWRVWSIDLQGPEKLFSRCLVSNLASKTVSGKSSTASSSKEKGEALAEASGLRNRRRATPRRRGDPLDVSSTYQEHTPQLLFSRIRAFSKAGPAVAATYGNNLVLVEPPLRASLTSVAKLAQQ